MPNSEEYLSTTPIYYVNDKPHIGHLYTSLLADCFTRFIAIFDLGSTIRMISGTDEHGNKIQRSAELKNQKAIILCNDMSSFFKRLLVDFNICCSYEDFSILNFEKYKDTQELFCKDQNKTFNNNANFTRTTDGRDLNTGIFDCEKINNKFSHINFVRSIWSRMIENNWIYLGKYSGFYSIKDESFYNENELLEGKAPTGSDVVFKEEDCYFFRLSKMKILILEFLHKAKQNKLYIKPTERINELLNFTNNHLEDLPISRIKNKESRDLYWGIPVPNDENHIMYVWLDALFNYISAFKENDIDKALKKWENTKINHFIGKEISKFHAIYWVSFIVSLKYKYEKIRNVKLENIEILLFQNLFIHGWWTNEGKKISKSDGNIVDPYKELNWLIESSNIQKEIAVDYIRLFLVCSFSTSKDADYSRIHFAEFINSNLIKNIGNLIQRVFALFWQVKAKEPSIDILKNKNTNILIKIKQLNEIKNEKYILQKLQEFDLMQISKMFFEIGNILNKFIDSEKPWGLIKEERFEEASNVIATSLYGILEIVKILSAFMPFISSKILNLFGVEFKDLQSNELIISEKNIKKIEGVLFSKIYLYSL